MNYKNNTFLKKQATLTNKYNVITVDSVGKKLFKTMQVKIFYNLIILDKYELIKK